MQAKSEIVSHELFHKHDFFQISRRLKIIIVSNLNIMIIAQIKIYQAYFCNLFFQVTSFLKTHIILMVQSRIKTYK